MHNLRHKYFSMMYLIPTKKKLLKFFHSCRNDLVEIGKGNALDWILILAWFSFLDVNLTQTLHTLFNLKFCSFIWIFLFCPNAEEEAQTSDFSMEAQAAVVSQDDAFLNIQTRVTQESSVILGGNEKHARKRTQRYGFTWLVFVDSGRYFGFLVSFCEVDF